MTVAFPDDVIHAGSCQHNDNDKAIGMGCMHYRVHDVVRLETTGSAV